MTAPWEYRDPLEAKLAAEVSAPTLMEHVRIIGAWERESGSPGEAQAFDYIERTLKSYGLEVERREIEAYISLPLEGRVRLDDGTVIEGLTSGSSASWRSSASAIASCTRWTPRYLSPPSYELLHRRAPEPCENANPQSPDRRAAEPCEAAPTGHIRSQ